MKKIFISFDVDGTIVKPEYNDLIWFKELPWLYAQKYSVDMEQARETLMKEYEKVGEGDLRWYILQYWIDHFGLEVEEEKVLQKYEDKVELYQDTLVVLNELQGRFPLVVASAMPHSFIDVKLGGRNLFRYFERVFSAVSDFKMIKKEKFFYQKVCEELGASPGELVHIGDNYEADYIAPGRAGVRAFFLDRTNSHSLADFHIVSTLVEFLHRLKKLTTLY